MLSGYKGITVEGKSIEVGVSDSKISFIKEIENSDDLPLIGVPLVDTQNNGAIDFCFLHVFENVDRVSELINFYRSHGVGKVFPTIASYPIDIIRKSASALIKIMENDQDVNDFFPGIFHEGVYISKKDGWRGGHDTKYIKNPNYEEFSETNKAFGNKIKIVNVAPEESGAMNFIERAVSDGIRVSLGHAYPNEVEVAEAVKRGATMVTHFGNGANPIIHRHKNPFWSFLAHDELTLGLIGDGFHLPPDVIKMAYKVKGRENVVMVSDCATQSGLEVGLYENGTVTIEPNGYMKCTPFLNH